jgi:chromate transport protein ChrA
VGFTLPSAIVLVLFAYGVTTLAVADAPWLHGLKVVAVAVVAQAVWGMARNLCPDRMAYNFARIHTTRRVTPAMETCVSDHVWTLSEIAALADRQGAPRSH